MSHLHFNLEDTHKADAYKILASLVTPRPIAWTTTQDTNGIVNAAPFSFFNVFGTRPPVVVIAPGDKETGIPKDTAKNIREHQEFVIHLVDESLGNVMNATASELPHGQSELEGLGLTLLPCESISVPRIAEAPAALECVEHSTLQIGQNRLIIGLVKRVWAREGIFDPETLHLDVKNYQPLGRMTSPDWYTRTADLFEMERPE